MTELLTPEKVRLELADADSAVYLELGDPEILVVFKFLARLCRDYLTLWERNKELEALIPKRLIERLSDD